MFEAASGDVPRALYGLADFLDAIVRRRPLLAASCVLDVQGERLQSLQSPLPRSQDSFRLVAVDPSELVGRQLHAQSGLPRCEFVVPKPGFNEARCY